MTVIADVLNLMRLRVEVYHNARVCGDWRINEHELGVCCFHMPTQGDCLLSVPGEGEWHLYEGDVVIFPRELPHHMIPSTPLQGPQQHLPIDEAQSVEGTSLLCGVVKFQHFGGEQLIQILPKVLVVSARQNWHWLHPLTTLIVKESFEGGAIDSPVLNRLCELLMVYTLRYIAENQPKEQSIFALYAHPKLVKAVKAVHQNPTHAWRLSSLASTAGMSRTSFSNLFSQVAGMTATAYLTWWRMQIAWSKLQEGLSVEQVAEQVGYRSEAAFARTFKEYFGQTVGSARASTKLRTANKREHPSRNSDCKKPPPYSDEQQDH